MAALWKYIPTSILKLDLSRLGVFMIEHPSKFLAIAANQPAYPKSRMPTEPHAVNMLPGFVDKHLSPRVPIELPDGESSLSV